MEKSTDDLYTFNEGNKEVSASTNCKCMFHWGEYPQTHCSVSTEQTSKNEEALREYGA